MLLVLSDIHLGNGQGYDIFAGRDALVALLDRHIRPDVHLFINGDFVDFLMNEDPLELSLERALAQARAIVAAPDSAAVLQALGRILAAGGAVTIRLGNHDVELALPAVQSVLRNALGQPAAIAARLRFQSGEQPHVEEIGGARVLLTHGEHADPWNRYEAAGLALAEGAPAFCYPPGSRLVKSILNPLKRQFGLRFADLLKPDFQGAVLTALAVDPAALRVIFQGSTASLLWQLLHASQGPVSFGDPDEVDLGLADRVDEAGLSEEERQALADALDESMPVAFSEEEPGGPLDRARIKLLQAGLRLYARWHREVAGPKGDRYFALDPTDEEWAEARRLAEKYEARAVILGHSHAARFCEDDGIVYANTGTWAHLLRLPPAEAPLEAWQAFLDALRHNPSLEPGASEDVPVATRFTAARVSGGESGGVRLELLEIGARGEERVLGEARAWGGGD